MPLTIQSVEWGSVIPNSSILWTSSLEKPLAGILGEEGLSQKCSISATHARRAGICCLTGEVRNGCLFPSYKSLSVAYLLSWPVNVEFSSRSNTHFYKIQVPWGKGNHSSHSWVWKKDYKGGLRSLHLPPHPLPKDEQSSHNLHPHII